MMIIMSAFFMTFGIPLILYTIVNEYTKYNPGKKFMTVTYLTCVTLTITSVAFFSSVRDCDKEQLLKEKTSILESYKAMISNQHDEIELDNLIESIDEYNIRATEFIENPIWHTNDTSENSLLINYTLNSDGTVSINISNM